MYIHTTDEKKSEKKKKGPLDENINLEVLMQLKMAFQAADKDHGGDLDIDEFVTAFMGVMGDENSVGAVQAVWVVECGFNHQVQPPGSTLETAP